MAVNNYFGASFANAITAQIQAAQERQAREALEKRMAEREQARIAEQRRYAESIRAADIQRQDELLRKQSEAAAARQAVEDQRYQKEQERENRLLGIREKESQSLIAQRKADAAMKIAKTEDYIGVDGVAKLSPVQKLRYDSLKRNRDLLVSQLNSQYRSFNQDPAIVMSLNEKLTQVESELGNFLDAIEGVQPKQKQQQPAIQPPLIYQQQTQQPQQDTRKNLGLF